MTIKILLDRRSDVRLMQQLCFALGYRASGMAFEQLVDQLFDGAPPERRSRRAIQR